jgi:IS30 family transposase
MGAGYTHLNYGERLAIMDGRRDGLSMRAIARMLGRDPATVSRELRRAPWLSVSRYDVCSAHFGAVRRRSRSRTGGRKLRLGSALFDTVAGHVREGWSPLQIAGRLRRMENDDRRRRVCHETIYLALYALPRGELRRELLACLRQGRQARRPRSRGCDRRSWVPNDLRIAVRPEDIEERQIPGHWEGDLIKGAFNRSAVGTLVERSSRLVMLAQLDAPDAHATQQGFERLFDQMPHGLRKTMTYDRGTEMTCHVRFSNHCFTEEFDPACHGQTLLVMDHKRARAFDRRRYELSRNLPAMVAALPAATVHQTPERRNYLYYVTLAEPTDPDGLYQMFFTLRKAGRAGPQHLELFVESAYAAAGTVRLKRPNAIRFAVLAWKIHKGEAIRFAPR